MHRRGAKSAERKAKKQEFLSQGLCTKTNVTPSPLGAALSDLGSHAGEAFEEGSGFLEHRVFFMSRREFGLEPQPAQGLTTVCVRWPALLIIPRRVATVANLRRGARPSPYLDQSVHPQVQIEGAHVAPDITYLLLPGSPNFLSVVEYLLNRGTIRELLDDLHRRRPRIGAEERLPAAVVVLHQHHPDHAAY